MTIALLPSAVPQLQRFIEKRTDSFELVILEPSGWCLRWRVDLAWKRDRDDNFSGGVSDFDLFVRIRIKQNE